MPQTQEFDFLGGVTPLSQQGKKPLPPPPIPGPPKPAGPPSPQFSFLDELSPLGAKPQKPESSGVLDKIKAIASDFLSKRAKRKEDEAKTRGTPKQPVMAAMTPKETATFERGTVPIPPRRFPKAEDLEYGKLEQLLDIPSQFLMNWVNMRAFGLPGLIHEKLTGEKLPGAKTALGEVSGAGGALYGLANFPVKGVALGKGYAPFEVTRGLAQRVLGKPMKSVAGRLVQRAVENVATLGLGMGAVEWQGRDPVEILQNKLRATGGGAITGLVFSGAEYVNFAKLYPTMNHILRFGVASALLDMAHGTSPFDERTLFEKSFDYGLNWIFTKEGVSPKEYKAFWKRLNRELLRFKSEAKEDGVEFLMPTEQALEDRITQLAGDPSQWAEPPTSAAAPKALAAPVGYEVMPGGTVIRPGMPEPGRTLVELREQEIRPEERAESVINIKQREDGSIDVRVSSPPKAPPEQAPTEQRPTIEQAGTYPRGFNANGQARVKDFNRFFFGTRGFIDDGWIVDYNPETKMATAVRKGLPEEGILTESGRQVYRSRGFKAEGKIEPEEKPEPAKSAAPKYKAGDVVRVEFPSLDPVKPRIETLEITEVVPNLVKGMEGTFGYKFKTPGATHGKTLALGAPESDILGIARPPAPEVPPPAQKVAKEEKALEDVTAPGVYRGDTKDVIDEIIESLNQESSQIKGVRAKVAAGEISPDEARVELDQLKKATNEQVDKVLAAGKGPPKGPAKKGGGLARPAKRFGKLVDRDIPYGMEEPINKVPQTRHKGRRLTKAEAEEAQLEEYYVDAWRKGDLEPEKLSPDEKSLLKRLMDEGAISKEGFGSEKAAKEVREEPEIEYEAAPRKPTVAIRDKARNKVFLGVPGETTHADMVERLQGKGIKIDDMVPGWVTPEGKWTENLREAARALPKEKVEEPWREKLIDYFDRRTKGPMALGPFEAKSIHRQSVEKALSEGKPVAPEVLKDYPDLAKPEPEFKLTQEEEVKPPPEKEAPKPEEPALFEKPEVERAFPAGFDNRGIKSYPDIMVAREDVQKHADSGWNVEFGQTPGGEAAWARLLGKQPEGRGSLKYVGLRVKPEFLKKPEWQPDLSEKPPLEVKEEADDKARREVEKQAEPKEVSEAVEEKRAETPAVKEVDERLEAIEKDVEEALKEGRLNRELTAEEKLSLQAKGKYEEGKPAPEKPTPTPTPEAEPPTGKRRLVRVSVKIPTGTTEELGELPVEMVDRVKEYAKKLGVEGDLVIGKEFEGKWGEWLSPKDIEAVVKEVLRDVKRKPKEWWEQWEQKAEKTREVWAGIPPPEFAKKAARWFLDALQIEPQFKRIGAPDTGLAFKRYHPIRNAEMERGLDAIASMRKKHSGLKLSKEEWQELTFLAATEKRFEQLSPERKARYGEIVRDIRKFFDDYAKREKELGIFVEEWPKSALRRLIAERDHYKQALRRLKNDTPRRDKVLKELKEVNETIRWINEARPQYIHIPKTWLEKFWEKNAEKAPKLITEFFHERKTFDIEQLADYLLKHRVISKNDLDIRGIMALYGHKAGHKIALAEIFRAGEKEGLIRDMDEAPKSWQTLPGHKFPTLRGKRVHPVFVDFFEKNFIKRGFAPPTMGKILGTVKMLQFYNPAFLPMYDVFQAWWTGSVRSPKTPLYIKRAFGSMKNKDDAYWDAHYWGAFSTPFTPNFESYAKQVDRAVKGHSFIRKAGDFISVYPIAWKAAWWGDNLIRLITYHHYIEKGESPRDAAQLTARAHADYASIPPATRKFLNKWFFTPSFKISMMAAQSEMIKNSAKYLFGGKEGRAKMTKLDKGMAKMVTGLVTGMALREVTLHALGFKTDQYGLKYVKKIIDESGEEKELVLHTANPDNVFLRFFHRFKSLPMEANKLSGFIDRAKWELHPLWQLGMEVMSNKGFSMEPIYDVFDKPEEIVKDITSYGAKRIIRVLELLPGEEERGRGKVAYRALIKDLGSLGQVLSLFALPYLRNAPEVRLQYKMQNLIQQFKNLERGKPASSEKEMEQRISNLEKHLKRIYEELEQQ